METPEDTFVGGDFDWKEIPFTYRMALHISNHLLGYLPLLFVAGVVTGLLIAG
jgi:hypothetical protein